MQEDTISKTVNHQICEQDKMVANKTPELGLVILWQNKRLY